MIHVIYMAAGNSRRFGSNKLLYLYEGKPLYRHGLELLLKLKQEMGEKLTVTVVTQYAEILEEVQDIFERCGMAGMQAVFCEESRLGASYTIRAGIEAVISQDPVSGQPKEGQSMIGDPVPPLRQHPRQSLHVPRRSYPGAYVPHRRPGRTESVEAVCL